MIIKFKEKNVRPFLERKLWVIQHYDTLVSFGCQQPQFSKEDMGNYLSGENKKETQNFLLVSYGLSLVGFLNVNTDFGLLRIF